MSLSPLKPRTCAGLDDLRQAKDPRTVPTTVVSFITHSRVEITCRAQPRTAVEPPPGQDSGSLERSPGDMPVPPVDGSPPSASFVGIAPEMSLVEPYGEEKWWGHSVSFLSDSKDPCDLWLSPGDAGPHGEVGEEEKKTCEQMFDHFFPQITVGGTVSLRKTVSNTSPSSTVPSFTGVTRTLDDNSTTSL